MGVKVVRREQSRHHVHGDEHGGVVERPAAQEDVERAALERTEARRTRDAGPEGFERLACAVGTAIGIAVGKHCRVHGSGRGA
jgi:hypothetical protein